MCILENHQQLIFARSWRNLYNQRFERFLPPLLRRQFEHWITSVARKRQHFHKKRRIVRRCRALREQSIELIEFRLRGVVLPKTSGALDPADSRIQCAVGMLWRTEIAQPGMWLASNLFQQRSGQSRFADARFTREQHHLPLAALRLRPAAQQQFEFFFTPDKLGYAACVQSLKAALH